jgi:ribonuclease Y
MPVTAMIAGAAVGVVVGAVVVWLLGRRRSDEQRVAARAEAAAITKAGELEAAALRQAAINEAREQAVAAREAADGEMAAAVQALAARAEEQGRQQRLLEAKSGEIDAAHAAIDARFDEVKRLGDRARGLEQDAERRRQEGLALLEQRCGTTADQVTQALRQRWIEDAQAAAAQRVRMAEQGGDGGADASARRLMEVAMGRYKGHFLTERAISRLPLEPWMVDLLTAEDARMLRGIEQAANVQMLLSDERDHVKLDGLDGVGREVARRAVARLAKKPEAVDEARADPAGWATRIREQLDQEIVAMGRKAFTVLEVKRAHPEIVELVGALNYRTSYTQNQWLHAVEASFLCGMMAEELGLDVATARRACLMHDIGKALTHKIEGSHAVIGADIARRLGEAEVVANAIGAHHLDEPMSSPYAFLVAAADAMSGARPGARREMSDGYTTKLADLERIGASFRGVDRAHAVHGGRELRVYVREGQVSDLDAIELSAQIAAQVSQELVFPGQIKVTVIRAFEAVATAN